MNRKLFASVLAAFALVAFTPAFAAEVSPAPEAQPAPTQLEPLPWLDQAATASPFCVGTCNGSSEIIFYCDSLNPEKCCQLLFESGICYSFIGHCEGAWDARCRF